MATSQDFVNWVCSESLDPHFLMKAFLAEGDSLLKFGKGSTHTTIYFPEVLAFHIALPPVDEQRRIVAKLDALSERSRCAKEALDAVRPLLEKLRQSILAAAFRGDLTREWRAQNPDVEPASELLKRIPQPVGKNTGRDASVAIIEGRAALSVGDPKTPCPPGWVRVPLMRVAKLESGHTPSRQHPEWWGGDVPWIGIADAREHHGAVITGTSQYTNAEGLANSAARLLPAGTVCLSRTASVGYVTIMGAQMATSQDFVNWVCSDALSPEFLMYAILAEGEHLLKFGKGTTHTTIYFPEVKAFHITLPPRAEQDAVVARVKERLGVVVALHEWLADMEARYSELGPTILERAFRGKLVRPLQITAEGSGR